MRSIPNGGVPYARRVARRLILLALAVNACGGQSSCGGGGPTELSRASDAGMGLALQVFISPDNTQSVLVNFWSIESTYCPNLEATAEINGVVIPVETNGETRQPSLSQCLKGFCNASCVPNRWAADSTPIPSDSALSTLTILGGGDVWAMVVPHLYAKRALHLETPTLHPGDTLHFTWSPATDHIDFCSVSTAPEDSSFNIPEATADTRFVLPADLDAGQYTVFCSTEPTVAACDGPAFCQFGLNNNSSSSASFTVLP
jgi:hypothetical protein